MFAYQAYDKRSCKITYKSFLAFYDEINRDDNFKQEHMMNIRLKRLTLRDFVVSDYPFFYQLETDSSVIRFEKDNKPSDQEVIEHFNELIKLSKYKNRKKYSFCMVNHLDNKPVGRIVLWEIDHQNKEWEIGWFVHPDDINQGFATEAALEMIDFAFRKLSIHRLQALCHEKNIGSEKVMIKIGMKKEGTLRGVRKLNNKWCNMHIYALLDSDFMIKSSIGCEKRECLELWDAYKIDYSLAGCDLVRGQTIPRGLYHIVSEILVQHQDGSFLLMQRDFQKEGYPGMFEASAGGSVLKGENPYNAAIRELKEETGIEAKSLRELSTSVSEDTVHITYLCLTDINKSSIKLQKGESIAYKWISKDELLSFMQSNESIPPQRKRLLSIRGIFENE